MEFQFQIAVGMVIILFAVIFSARTYEKVPRLLKGIVITFVSYYLSKK